MSAAASGGDDGDKGGEKKITRKEAWQFVDLHMNMVSSDKDELILKRLSERHPNPTLIKHAHDSSKSSEELKEMSAGVNEPLMNKSRVVNAPLPNIDITHPLLPPQHVDDDDDDKDDDDAGEHHHKKKKQKIKNKDEDEGEGEGEGEGSKNQEEDGN